MSKSNETTPNVPTLRFKNYDDNYREITLKDVCTLITKGTTPAKFSTNGINFIKIDSLNGNYVDNSKVTHINESIHNTLLSRSILEENDILLAIAGATVGKHCIIQKSNLPANTNQALAIIRLNKHLLPYYLLAFFDTNYLPSYIKLICAASAQPNLNLQQVGQIKLNIPTIQEQERVCYFIQLLDKRISVQNKIISKYETLIKGIRERIVNCGWQWKKLDELIQEGIVRLNRGNIIPKHQKDNAYKYPVYSSSTQNNGLMGYNDTYMFDKELITWSIDGGGNFFYRKKHKFNVTNVCGILQVNENVYSYRFIAEMLTYQHSKMKFDYQSKAHPSVISSLYSLPCLPISEQNSYCRLFIALDKKMQIEQCCLNKLKEQKKYLLSKMFI